ncbi:MAG: tail fiber domain-containing protein [Sediminibacterium sp.]
MKKYFYTTILVCAFYTINAQTGIGTTSPVNKFQVETTVADPLTTGNNVRNGILRLSGVGVNHLLDVGLMNATNNFSAWLQARKKDDYSVNYNLLLNPNGGNVGIGTSNPTAKLNIAGGGIRIHNGFSNSTNRPAINTSTVGSYELRGVGSEGGTTQRDGGDDGFLRLSAGGGTNSNSQASIDLSGYSTVADMNSNIVMRTAGVERFRINNSGYVGIGNASPAQALDVTGTGKFSTSIINSGTRSYFGKDGSNIHWLATTDAVAEPYNLGYGIEASAGILSHRWNIAGYEKMRLSTNGYLGLGTQSPATTIHIENGNIFGTNPSSTSSPSLYIFNNNNASSTANATALIRTAGTSSGKPYLSLDISGVSGYSMGINNPTDQLIFNTTWNFTTGTAGNNAITINRSGQSRVVIPTEGGSVASGWPSGWGGGLITFDFSCAGIYYTTLSARSDKRLKNTIVDLDSSMIYKYLQLRPVNYYWNDGSDNKHRQYGLIAQEVEEFFPDIVSIANDSMQTKSVNYQALHALSLKVIQSQQAEIESLKKNQLNIEARLLKLEAKMNQ